MNKEQKYQKNKERKKKNHQQLDTSQKAKIK